MSDDPKTVEIFTDGACSPNPGTGGYGVIIACNGDRTELSGGFRKTTNNRMEIIAAIEGLKALSDDGSGSVMVYSDSRYVVDMFNGGYAAKWRANDWMRDKRHRALNPDLWGELLDLAGNRQVRFEWVRGHNEHPENERCDELAVEARQKDDLPPDAGYENPESLVTDGVFNQATFDWL